MGGISQRFPPPLKFWGIAMNHVSNFPNSPLLPETRQSAWLSLSGWRSLVGLTQNRTTVQRSLECWDNETDQQINISAMVHRNSNWTNSQALIVKSLNLKAAHNWKWWLILAFSRSFIHGLMPQVVHDLLLPSIPVGTRLSFRKCGNLEFLLTQAARLVPAPKARQEALPDRGAT